MDGATSYPITIFDTGSGAPLARVDSQSYRADLGVFSPDGTKFAMLIEPTGSIGWQTLVLHAVSGQVVLNIQASSGASTSYVWPEVFSPDSTESAVEEGSLDVVRVADGVRVKTFAAPARTASPSWTHLEGSQQSGEVAVSRASDGALVRSFQVDARDTMFAAGDQLIAAVVPTLPSHGADPAALYVWDVAGGSLLRVLPPSVSPGIAGSFALPGDGQQMPTLETGTAAVWRR